MRWQIIKYNGDLKLRQATTTVILTNRMSNFLAHTSRYLSLVDYVESHSLDLCRLSLDRKWQSVDACVRLGEDPKLPCRGVKRAGEKPAVPHGGHSNAQSTDIPYPKKEINASVSFSDLLKILR